MKYLLIIALIALTACAPDDSQPTRFLNITEDDAVYLKLVCKSQGFHYLRLTKDTLSGKYISADCVNVITGEVMGVEGLLP